MNRIQVISLLALFLAAINVGLAESLPFAITNAAEQKAEGEALVRQLLAQRPEASFSQNGWLKIRDGSGKKSEAALRFDTIVTTTNWSVVYDVAVTNSKGYTDGNLLKANKIHLVQHEHQEYWQLSFGLVERGIVWHAIHRSVLSI
jgi:hypothetical protein